MFGLSGQSAIAAQPTESRERLKSLHEASVRIAAAHVLKSPPQAGDWLAVHEEAGQTFEQYRNGAAVLPTRQRRTLYIQQLGTFDETRQKIVDATARMMSAFYGLPVKQRRVLDLKDLPQEAQRDHPQWGDHQLLTPYLLQNVLLPRRPRDAMAVLGLTPSDLWPGEDWNFVFGQADLRQRVGVWSMYRYGDPSQGARQYRLCLRRTLQVAIHETGHMLGIPHCTAYECGMNGANHMAEMDRNPMVFCPECVQKVWWVCDMDPLARYKALAQLARQYELDALAHRWAAARDRLDVDR
jgi:archaemetzincin